MLYGKSYKFKVYKDEFNETRVAIYIEGLYVDEVETHTGFSVKDAKESLKETYIYECYGKQIY